MSKESNLADNNFYSCDDSLPILIFKGFGDFIKRKFYKKRDISVSYLTFGLIILLFFLAVPIIFAILQGTFIASANTTYSSKFLFLSEDYFMMAMLVLMIPSGIILYYIYNQTPKVFKKLKKNLEINPKSRPVSFKTPPKTLYFLIILSLTVLVFLASFHISSLSNVPTWNSMPSSSTYFRFAWLQWIIFLYFQVLYLIIWYAIIELAIKGIVIFYNLEQLYSKSKLKLKRFAPDGCGEMKFMGKYALNFFSLATIIGIYIFWYFTLTYMENESLTQYHIIFPILYLLLAPMFFFGPLISTHNKIKAAKEKKLKQISKQLETHYSHINNYVGEKSEIDKKEIEKHSHVVDQLKKQHREWKNLNSWPIDSILFKNFIARYLSPFVTIPIQIFLSRG